MELAWDKYKSVKLTQKTSIGNLEKEHGLPASNVPKKSLPLTMTLFDPPKGPEEELAPDQLKLYQSLVGSLLYINHCTRPEISIQVNLLGRRTAKASQTNLQTAMHVLRYLVSSKEKGLTIRRNKNQDGKSLLKSYADASYGGEHSRSQSGNLTTLNGQAVMWSSRRQDIIALSITEAEYISCSEAEKDIRWLQQFLVEILPSLSNQVLPTSLYTDNEAALKLVKTQTFHRRTRHMEHRLHHIRELVEKGYLQLKGIAGKENPSDILTKVLPMKSVHEWTNKHGID